MDGKVNIELTKGEAIVLFEFLGRFNAQPDNKSFEHQAEQRILWNIESFLEKLLVEPFNENYSEILKKARLRVCDKK